MLENNIKYIIITPAYNEADYIEQTIEGVLAQSVLPYKWVIVDDGSTDDTAKIIQQYAEKHKWIRYIYRTRESGQSYYRSNVYAIMAGYEQVKKTDYDFLAILDADISLPKDYYERIFDRFSRDEKLGVASGVYQDLVNGRLRKVLNDRRSTPKAIQIFRKECFEQIGGYVPLKYGGEDTCSCIMARMKGWKSWSFPELTVVHNKPVGTGHAGNMLKIRFRHGLNEYGLATHPLFMIVKSLRRCIKERPFISGGLARIAGFLYGYCLREKRSIPDDMVRFIRKEQMRRLLNLNRIPKENRENTVMNAKTIKICLAASSGGHLSQLLRLADTWKGYEVVYVTTTDVMQNKFSKYGKVYIVGECNRQHPLMLMAVLLKSAKVIVTEKPDVVISTGAAAGCMLCFLGKLLGAKVIWIDSITNVERISLSGRMVRYIADLFLVQWSELAERYKNVEYVGAII